MEYDAERWHNGLLVRKLRTEAGWQQKQLAVRANCRAETISRWENGNEMPGDVIVRQIARALSGGLAEREVLVSEDTLYEQLKNSSLGVEAWARLLRTKLKGPLTMQPNQPPPMYRSMRATRSPSQGETEELDAMLGEWLRSEPPGVLLLLGEAGSGKTTALQRQLQVWARAPEGGPERLLIIPISDISKGWDPRLPPVEAADRVLADLLVLPAESRPFVRLRAPYRLVFFFDGIDASPTPDGKRHLEALAHSLCSLGQEKALVLATLRTSLYEDNEVTFGGPFKWFRQKYGPRSLKRVHLQPLDRADVRQFVERYVDSAPEYREVGADRFETWLDESEGAPALATLPFWLLRLLMGYFDEERQRRGASPRMVIRPILQKVVKEEGERLGADEGRLQELLGRLACELFLQERQERQRYPVGSLVSLLRAGLTEEEFKVLGRSCFIRTVREEGGGPSGPLEFRYALFRELFLAEHIQGRIRRGDSEFLGRPEIDRAFSANLRTFLDPECLQILEGELLDRGGLSEQLELNLIHLLLAHSLLYRHRPSDELLDHLRRRFPIYLQRLYVTEPKDDLRRAVGLARVAGAVLDRWERPSRGRMVEFVRVLSTIPEALLALAHLSVRYFGSAPLAIERLRAHLEEPLVAAGSLEESVYGVLRLADLVALYAVVRYYGPTRPDLFERAPSERLLQLLAAVRDDSERRLRGGSPCLSVPSEGHPTQAAREAHRLTGEWLGRITSEIQRLPIRSP
ncbi:MAG TPA: NACHT domain-containing protein [Polyangia bacterium]|nr:NACHT domain-containing protein [Polyangia bacterium]